MAASTLDFSTPAARQALATRIAHACIASYPDLLKEGLLALAMHGGDALSRVVARHLSNALDDPPDSEETLGLGDSLTARMAPPALVLELRETLGDALAKQLEAPLASKHVRVLWLAGEYEVIDVLLETAHVVELEREMDHARLASDPRIGPAAIEPMERDVANTWQDTSRYLPMPIPKGWVVSGIDRVGVLTVIVDDRVVLELCAVEMPEKFLFVALHRTMESGIVTPKEAGMALDRLRNVRRPFEDVSGEETIKAIFGDNQVWVAPVLESAVTEMRGQG